MNRQQAIDTLALELEADKLFYDTVKKTISNAFLSEYARYAVDQPAGFVWCPTETDLDVIADNTAAELIDLFQNKG